MGYVGVLCGAGCLYFSRGQVLEGRRRARACCPTISIAKHKSHEHERRGLAVLRKLFFRYRLSLSTRRKPDMRDTTPRLGAQGVLGSHAAIEYLSQFRNSRNLMQLSCQTVPAS